MCVMVIITCIKQSLPSSGQNLRRLGAFFEFSLSNIAFVLGGAVVKDLSPPRDPVLLTLPMVPQNSSSESPRRSVVTATICPCVGAAPVPRPSVQPPYLFPLSVIGVHRQCTSVAGWQPAPAVERFRVLMNPLLSFYPSNPGSGELWPPQALSLGRWMPFYAKCC